MILFKIVTVRYYSQARNALNFAFREDIINSSALIIHKSVYCGVKYSAALQRCKFETSLLEAGGDCPKTQKSILKVEDSTQ